MNYHSKLMHTITQNFETIQEAIEKLSLLIIQTLKNNRSIWLIGNGGSASTVEHFETDISFLRYGDLSMSSRVTALTSNTSLITAAANDISYSKIFATLIYKKASSGDLLISVSASGNSDNIIQAVRKSKERNITTYSLIGFNGGQLLGLSDFETLIKSEIGEYEIIEDIHLSIFHAVKLKILKDSI